MNDVANDPSFGRDLRLTVGRHTVELSEASVTDDERYLQLTVDRTAIGRMVFLKFYSLNVGISESDLAFWAGQHLYTFSFATASLASFNLPDPVHAAFYLAPASWLLVCEISVVLIDCRNGTVTSEYSHDEVILWWWWDGDRLYLEDLQARRLAVEVSNRLRVTPVAT